MIRSRRVGEVCLCHNGYTRQNQECKTNVLWNWCWLWFKYSVLLVLSHLRTVVSMWLQESARNEESFLLVMLLQPIKYACRDCTHGTGFYDAYSFYMVPIIIRKRRLNVSCSFPRIKFCVEIPSANVLKIVGASNKYSCLFHHRKNYVLRLNRIFRCKMFYRYICHCFYSILLDSYEELTWNVVLFQFGTWRE